jgi:hypothetical protein
MLATKIIHRGESRIKVDFPYNQEIAVLIKQIPDAKWSKTYRAWHIPYSPVAFNQLKALFPEIDYPNKLVQDKNEAVKNSAQTSGPAEKTYSLYTSHDLPSSLVLNVFFYKVYTKEMSIKLDQS